MSLVARVILAAVATFFGILMCLVVPQTDKAIFFYLFAAFCFAIAVVCFAKGRLAHFIGGLIAASVLALGFTYLGSMLTSGMVFSSHRSDESVLNACLFLVFFGVPSARYLWGTRFGFGKQPKPLNESLEVSFDDAKVYVRVIEGMEDDWNQSFDWKDVERVCFKDEGLSNSDILFIQVQGRAKPIAIFTEAKGGNQLFGELANRGLFPEQVWRKAIADTSGGMHCWP